MLALLFMWYVSIILWIKTLIAWIGCYVRIMQTQPFKKCQIHEVVDEDTAQNLTCEFCWVFTFQPQTAHTLEKFFSRNLRVTFQDAQSVEVWHLDGTEYYRKAGAPAEDRKKFSFKQIKFRTKSS